MTIFGDPWWAELLSIGNVFFFTLLAVFSFCQARRQKGFSRWMNALMGLIGCYWAGLYVFVFLTPSGVYDSVAFGQIFVRPMFTFTAGVMSSMALFHWRSGDRCE